MPAGLVDDDQAGLGRSRLVVVVVGVVGVVVGLARLLVRVGLAGVRRARAGRDRLVERLARLRQHLVEVPGALGQRVVR